MIQFNKPKNLNGTELLAELNAAGIVVTEPPFDDGQDNIWLQIATSDKAKATLIVTAHNGTIIAPEPTVADKLASVGLNLTDLKSALGI